ncbi:MAG: phosphatase PAP2 family protein [Acidobacteria bacterium]|nr:phosphatase PAP2 family protein [Acidobacteriota bacterium]
MIDDLVSFDNALRVWIATLPTPGWLDTTMLALSAVGRRGSIWLALGIGRAIWRPALAMPLCQLALAIGLAGLTANVIVKPSVARVRPFDAVMDVRVVGERPHTYSFPSGHAATAFAGAFALTRTWRRARRALWTLAILIALSRVYLGVHYPIDVIAGALVGLACGYFAVGGTKAWHRLAEA